MTTDQVLGIVKERGLTVLRLPDGTLILRGPTSQATPELLRVLRFHRGEIEARLSPPAPPRLREFRWRFGHTSVELEAGGPAPVGAWWWRYEGEAAWRPVPGTPGEAAEAA